MKPKSRITSPRWFNKRRDVKICYFFLAVSILFVAWLQTGYLEVPKSIREPYSIIQRAPRFAIGGIGMTGETSKEEAALQKILLQPDASALCKKLLNRATPEGKMYALLGLFFVDKPLFVAQAPRFCDSLKPIVVQEGCCVTKSPISFTYAEIACGGFDSFKRNFLTMKEKRKRMRPDVIFKE